MAEFSATSGIPVATIKFYLREKLLPAGESETSNQASYGVVHLDRLRLIRALIDVGGLGVASAHSVLEAIDSDAPLPEVFQVAQRSVSATSTRSSRARTAQPRPKPSSWALCSATL